jgi:hypothetical protein
VNKKKSNKKNIYWTRLRRLTMEERPQAKWKKVISRMSGTLPNARVRNWSSPRNGLCTVIHQSTSRVPRVFWTFKKVGSTDLQIWTDRNHALSSINEMAFY